MTTGQRIKDARKKAGLTQTELADKLGIPYQSIGQWERDTRKPKQETLLKIAKALGVHLRDLADTSMWEEFDQQNPKPDVEEYATIVKLLELFGFDIQEQPIEAHQEDVFDEAGRLIGSTQSVDEIEYKLSKNGHSATFTQAEFDDLQAGAREAIEGRFYKKVLEQGKG